MNEPDEYKRWFQDNRAELIETFAASNPPMAFDAFCEMKFMERKEPLPIHPMSLATFNKLKESNP